MKRLILGIEEVDKDQVVYDVEAQLVLITLINADGDFNIFLTPIELIKDKSWALNRISKNDKHAEFAFQFNFLRLQI